jgi:endonuclease/exonuclease/phosphatase family metal-dependent hydrolase
MSDRTALARWGRLVLVVLLGACGPRQRTVQEPILASAEAPLPSEARLSVISANIGGGIRGRYAPTCTRPVSSAQTPVSDSELSVAGMGELLRRESAQRFEGGADQVVIALEEVDLRTARNPGRDIAALLTAELDAAGGRDFAHQFMSALNVCPQTSPTICLLPDRGGLDPSACPRCRGEFGLALIASTDFREVRERRLAWYPPSAFDAEGWRPNADFQEYGREPRVALAGRIPTDVADVWVIVVHLGGTVAPNVPAEHIALRQVAEVVAFAGELASDLPILVVGDFNLIRRGQHRTNDPRYASDGAGYAEMRRRFGDAGFVELGDWGEQPCWEADRCTINAWGHYSAVDYAWLRDPSGVIRDARLSLISPEIEAGCYLTDHRMMSVDLHLERPVRASSG